MTIHGHDCASTTCPSRRYVGPVEAFVGDAHRQHGYGRSPNTSTRKAMHGGPNCSCKVSHLNATDVLFEGTPKAKKDAGEKKVTPPPVAAPAPSLQPLPAKARHQPPATSTVISPVELLPLQTTSHSTPAKLTILPQLLRSRPPPRIAGSGSSFPIRSLPPQRRSGCFLPARTEVTQAATNPIKREHVSTTKR